MNKSTDTHVSVRSPIVGLFDSEYDWHNFQYKKGQE